MARIFRFVVIVLIAGVTYILGFVIFTGIKEAIKAFKPAVTTLWNFATGNPVLVIIALCCLLAASVAYDKVVKWFKTRKKKTEQKPKS